MQKAAPTSGDSHAVSWAWGPGRGKREGGEGGGDVLCVSESQKEDMAVEGGGVRPGEEGMGGKRGAGWRVTREFNG